MTKTMRERPNAKQRRARKTDAGAPIAAPQDIAQGIAQDIAQDLPQDDVHDLPRDIDAFRGALARRLHRLIGEAEGTWRTCREPCCRRARACMAPRDTCSNHEPAGIDDSDPRVAQTMAMLRRALDARVREGRE